ncbi:MAG TPA: inositol monophosphatase family protein [Acidimicrobiales bacterium]
MPPSKHEATLSIALRLADVADDVGRTFVGSESLEVRRKPDGSPVTAADLAIEEAIAAAAQSLVPGDAFVGEEIGPFEGSDRRWIVDGIDGTGAFARGEPHWGTLIACVIDEVVVAGVVTSIGLDRRWWGAVGGGAWTAPLSDSHTDRRQRLGVSLTSELERARVLVLPPADVRSPVLNKCAARLERIVALNTAPWHHVIRVAEGAADASVHFGGDSWDHAAFIPIIEEAGGRFSDLFGGRRFDLGNALFSNGVLHEALLEGLGNT